MTSSNQSRATVPIEWIRTVAERLGKQFHAERVILYGSQAYGQPREDSDIDLLVVTPLPPARLEAWRLTRPLREEAGFALQIVFMSTTEFEETKDVVGGLAYPAYRWGSIVYAAQR